MSHNVQINLAFLCYRYNEYRFLLFSAFQKTRSFSNECVIAKTTLNDLVSSASGGGGEGALYATNKFSLRPQPSNPLQRRLFFNLQCCVMFQCLLLFVFIVQCHFTRELMTVITLYVWK